jgi:HEAT repeat protein
MHTPDAREDDDAIAPPPCAPELLQELLRQLDKTVRLHQLYPITNPTYLKTLDALRAAFRTVWDEARSVTLQVSETQFTCGHEVVLDEPEKASDSLPWTLFKDGVRQLTLSSGFEEHELETLLDIIPKVRRAQDYEDDVLTLLWTADFEHLSYRYVDTVSSEGVPLDPSATPGRWPASTTVRGDTREAVEAARKRALDARSGLEKMLRTERSADDDAERERAEAMRHLRDGIAKQYATDLRVDVTDVLLDIFELQREPAVRLEVARHIDTLMLMHLASRSFEALARLLRESQVAVTRGPNMTEDARIAMTQLGARLSDPALLDPLLEWVESAEPRPSSTSVADVVARLGVTALAAMFHWMTDSRHHDLRVLYAAAGDRLAALDPAELVKLVGNERESVAHEAMRRCGALKLDASVVALVKQLGHAAESRRTAALAALIAIGSHRALAGVERALGDASSAVRITAIKALTVAVYRPVLARVTEQAQGTDVRDMDGHERRALFELYGTLCGDAGVPWLSSQLIGAKGFFKRKSDPETRACAAAALGRINTPAARDVLRAAVDLEEPLIRQAVRAALARGGDA